MNDQEVDPAALLTLREDTPYFAAVGRFITEYTGAEGAVHAAARAFSGLSNKRSRIVFDGMRLADLADKIRHFLKADKKEHALFQELDACLTQLNIISKERNKIVHREVRYQDGALSISNEATYKLKSSLEEEVISVAQLEMMRKDCANIFVRLYIAAARPSWLGSTIPKWMRIIYEDWSYKPTPRKRPTPRSEQKRSVAAGEVIRGRASRA